ncbi:MAG: hypothetical protein J2P37_17380 [Ktedonobacteraceae bacterium]|nr:hypothetical protein [Ktedonobacteraceae bacterium]
MAHWLQRATKEELDTTREHLIIGHVIMDEVSHHHGGHTTPMMVVAMALPMLGMESAMANT